MQGVFHPAHSLPELPRYGAHLSLSSFEIDEAIRKDWAELDRGDLNRAVELVNKVSDTIPASAFPRSSALDRIIRRVTCNVRDNCNSCLLITGVSGVGKTTLMRRLWTVLSALQGPKLIAIYPDYETSYGATLTELILKHFEVQIPLPSTINLTDGGDDFSTLLQRLWEAGYQVAMFLDRIQALFVPRNYHIRYLEIIGEIAALGRSEFGCFGVLSGSTCLRYLASHFDPFSKEGNYPTLNCNVYREYPLNPVRNAVSWPQSWG